VHAEAECCRLVGHHSHGVTCAYSFHSGAGIAGLCLAAELQSSKDIRVDVYETYAKYEEIQTGANVTLWGRVCDALRVMGLAEDCIKASKAATSKGATCASSS